MELQPSRVFARGKGFTLIELMIVVVIVAILAAIAIPSYSNMIRKARRADAVDALLLVQSLEEKYRANNSVYGSLNEIGFETDANNSELSNEGHYLISAFTTEPDGTAIPTSVGYRATAVAQGDQASDTGCTTMHLTVTAASPRGNKTPADCWD